MFLRIFNSFVIFSLLVFCVWLVSTPLQRVHYLSILGFHDKDETNQKEVAATGLSEYKELTQLILPNQGFQHAPANFCQDEGARNPSRTSSASVYKWIDDKGVINFSDKKPVEESNVKKIGDIILRGNKFFSLSLATNGLKLPPLFRDDLNAEILSVFQFFTRYLSPDNLSPVHINLTLINGKKRFAHFRDKYTSGLSTSSGFYTSNNNLAAARWTGKKRTLQVAKHEISHLIIGNLFGNPPTWFNEGLAEFVEHLETRQNASIAKIEEHSLNNIKGLLSRNDLPDFSWLMKSTYKDWEKKDKTLMYQYSWLVMHYLLTDPKGKKLIKGYLDHLAKNRCHPINTKAFFAKHYKKGLKEMEREWMHWLLHEQKMPIHF